MFRSQRRTLLDCRLLSDALPPARSPGIKTPLSVPVFERASTSCAPRDLGAVILHRIVKSLGASRWGGPLWKPCTGRRKQARGDDRPPRHDGPRRRRGRSSSATSRREFSIASSHQRRKTRGQVARLLRHAGGVTKRRRGGRPRKFVDRVADRDPHLDAAVPSCGSVLSLVTESAFRARRWHGQRP